MSDSTEIQWTDSTWNVVTGCTRVSRGCARCYIVRTPPFRMNGRKFVAADGESTTGVTLHPERLEQPYRWRKPRRVFVCSLADLFHDDVPDEYIARVFETMRCAPQHTFQVLTKRPERAREWFARCGDDEGLGWITHDGTPPGRAYSGTGIVVGDRDRWPLPNVWLGVSIENSRFTWRADVLREIPAAVRFISAEPLLGSLYQVPGQVESASEGGGHRASSSTTTEAREQGVVRVGGGRRPLDLAGIDWVICGGESGPRARPCYLEHIREIVQVARDCALCASMMPRVLVGGGEQLGYAPVWWHDDGEASYACTAHGQRGPAIFVKQLGARPLERFDDPAPGVETYHLRLSDRKGGDWDEWPQDLRVREFPRSAA